MLIKYLFTTTNYFYFLFFSLRHAPELHSIQNSSSTKQEKQFITIQQYLKAKIYFDSMKWTCNRLTLQAKIAQWLCGRLSSVRQACFGLIPQSHHTKD